MSRHLLFKTLTIWFLLTQCFPPYFYFVHMGGALTLAGFVGGATLLFPNLLGKKSILAMLVYGLIMYLYYSNGNAFFDSFSSVIVPFLSMMSALLIIEYVLKYDSNYSFTKLAIFEVVILNLLMILISIPQLLINPNIIRGASTSGIEGKEQQIYYWIVSYATVHGIPLLMAPLSFFCRKLFSISKKAFWIWSGIVVLLYLIVFLSNATTAFIVATMMIAVGAFFSFEQFTSKNLIKLIFVGSLAFVLTLPPIIVPILDVAQSMMNPSADNYSKVDEMKDNLIYGEATGDYAIRQELYDRSKKLFWESPITGTDRPNMISNHTFIWDRLALYGIFMVIPLVMIFVFNIKGVYHKLHHTKVTYMMGIAGFLFLLYMKNEFGTGTWLYGFTILPLLCRYIDREIDVIKKDKVYKILR